MGNPKVDRRGVRLSPGERFQNWIGGIMQLWPVLLLLFGGTAALNKSAIGDLISGGDVLALPDGQLTTPEADAEVASFHAQVRQSLAAINAAVNANTSSISSVRTYATAATDIVDKRVDAVQDQLNQSDATNYLNLNEQIERIKELVN